MDLNRKLNDGNTIPPIGLGVWQMPANATAGIVGAAIKAGYRLIDTAAAYGNEQGVGDAVRATPVAREELFVTTKLWNSDQGYDRALRAFDASLSALRLDYVDLYLIHWPSPRKNLFVESWKALARLRSEGQVRSIGVSNFCPEHLERIIGETGVVPVLNQIELHPRFQQRAARAFHERHGIVTEAWSPLGKGQLVNDPLLSEIAKKHRKSPAQVVLRWHLENGLIAIPKSADPGRLTQNLDIFDFSLDADDMKRIDRLDSAGGRTGPDPLTTTL
jgi:2,5-diketo-D-gluconate reductase A